MSMNQPKTLDVQKLHWGGVTYAVPPSTRQLVDTIWYDISTPLICLVTGSRRTGKSVILKQTLNRLLTQLSVPPRQILFYEFSPHESTNSIWEIYDYYINNIADTHESTYLFFLTKSNT